LPEFLATLCVGTPAVGIFFDILIGKDHFECSTPMIEIQDILNQESVSAQCGDEEFIDPLIHSLAHGDFLTRRRSRMTGDDHPSLGQALPQFQPPSLKQLDDLTSVHPRHARCWWVSQHALDLGMLQELISSASCHQIHACQNELCNHRRVTILAIQTDQGHFWWESKVLQVGGDGLES
jgi:hypothetical protein